MIFSATFLVNAEKRKCLINIHVFILSLYRLVLVSKLISRIIPFLRISILLKQTIFILSFSHLAFSCTLGSSEDEVEGLFEDGIERISFFT